MLPSPHSHKCYHSRACTSGCMVCHTHTPRLDSSISSSTPPTSAVVSEASLRDSSKYCFSYKSKATTKDYFSYKSKATTIAQPRCRKAHSLNRRCPPWCQRAFLHLPTAYVIKPAYVVVDDASHSGSVVVSTSIPLPSAYVQGNYLSS
jgi:hypothetical protein